MKPALGLKFCRNEEIISHWKFYWSIDYYHDNIIDTCWYVLLRLYQSIRNIKVGRVFRYHFDINMNQWYQMIKRYQRWM